MRRPSRLLTCAIKLFILLSGALAAVIPVVLLVGILWASFPARDVVPGVTADRIQQVRLGMSPTQVVALLGRPYVLDSFKGSNSHSMANCGNFDATQTTMEVTDTTSIESFFRRVAADTAVHICDANDERRHDRRSKLTYSRHGSFFRTYPMLWVHFDKLARVENVYAKEYAADNYCIYSLTADASQNFKNLEALRRLFDGR